MEAGRSNEASDQPWESQGESVQKDRTEAVTKPCNKCGLPVTFKQLATGKWIAVNPDLTDHYFACRNQLHPESAGETFKISGGFIPSRAEP